MEEEGNFEHLHVGGEVRELAIASKVVLSLTLSLRRRHRRRHHGGRKGRGCGRFGHSRS